MISMVSRAMRLPCSRNHLDHPPVGEQIPGAEQSWPCPEIH